MPSAARIVNCFVAVLQTDRQTDSQTDNSRLSLTHAAPPPTDLLLVPADINCCWANEQKVKRKCALHGTYLIPSRRRRLLGLSWWITNAYLMPRYLMAYTRSIDHSFTYLWCAPRAILPAQDLLPWPLQLLLGAERYRISCTNYAPDGSMVVE